MIGSFTRIAENEYACGDVLSWPWHELTKERSCTNFLEKNSDFWKREEIQNLASFWGLTSKFSETMMLQ